MLGSGEISPGDSGVGEAPTGCECDVCGKILANRAGLKKHLMTHNISDKVKLVRMDLLRYCVQ